LRILLQSAPPHLDVERLAEQLAGLDGVLDVHDLHVWTLTSQMDVLSVHLRVGDGYDQRQVLDRARTLLRDEHKVSHATLQVEPEDHRGCAEVGW
jgi:cobalt-zinc-cadmium efflux system protein